MRAPSAFRFRNVSYMADGRTPVAGIEATNKRISALVERYRKAGSEVVWVVHTGDKTSTVQSIKGTPIGCIPGFEPQGNEHFIAKTHGSSFHDTDLHEYLQSKGIKNIVLVGYQPQLCVFTTAVSAQHLAYQVTVIRDCIGSHDLKSWDDKRDIAGDELCDTACDLFQDALGLVCMSIDILD